LQVSSEGPEAKSATTEAAAWLADYLSLNRVDDSQQTKADAKVAGHGVDAVKRARARIGAGAISHGFPRRTYWSAPGLSPDEVKGILDEL
ncbi:MAG: hypothetical protein ACP5P1_14740, partial [Acidimicrobiales bacterium]